MNKEQTEQVKAFLSKDAYVQLSGIEIAEVTEAYAVATAKIEPRHLNGNGCVQGGMLYTIADFAFALLSNYLHPITVTQSGKIDYLRAGYTDRIKATAREKIRVGRNTVCEVVIQDAKDEVLCICSFNGFVKDVASVKEK